MPGLKSVTSLPTASMIPANSWPIVTGGRHGNSPLKRCLSVPQNFARLDANEELVRAGQVEHIGLPPLSSGGALVARPWLRFHTPLIEPDVRIARIRLSDKTSRLRPRHVVSKPAQTNEPEVPIEVREWIAPAPSSPDFVLGAQPPAQPHRCVSVERPIRLVDGPTWKSFAHPRSVRFTLPTSVVVSCHVPDRSVSAWTFSTTRRNALLFDGR